MLAEDSQPWWRALSCDLNGVFQGGGAKGLLYAGALEAVAERNHWFRAVAGASAGAITATLIAAGLTPSQISREAAEGLASLRLNFLVDIVGRPLVSTKSLSIWLEGILTRQLASMGKPHARPGRITFSELYDATGIELFIVCVDVATRQPLIFGTGVTDSIAVSDAVIASSSIPFAFRPGRLEVATPSGTQVHRLMDGGVWANYPAFVFRDPSFRAYHKLNALPPSTTIGFALVVEPKSGAAPGQPVAMLEPNKTSHSDLGSGLKGWLRNPLVRLYFLTLVPLVMAIEFVWVTNQYGLLFLKDNFRNHGYPDFIEQLAGSIDGFFSSFWQGYWAAAITVAIVALAMMLLGATLIDSAGPALRTLMAVGTSVPYWCGASEEDHVVRLGVPKELSTFSFRVPNLTRDSIIQGARSETLEQLDLIIPLGAA